jgi:hypothetical protein
MATKKIIEKKTGEKYASKAAMMKHEKGESKAMQKKEMAKGPMQKKSSPVKQEKLVKTAKAAASLAGAGAKYIAKKAWEGVKALDRQAEGPSRQLKSVNNVKSSAKKSSAAKMKKC